MSKRSAAPPQPKENVTVVLDNGGATIKAGFAGEAHPVQVVPNLVAKAKGAKRRFVGDQIDLCEDVQGLVLNRPIDRGYVVDWDLQRDIWDHTLSSVLKVQPRKCSLVVTEPLFNFPCIQRKMDEIIFEDLGFNSYCRVLSPAMAHLHQQATVKRSGGQGESVESRREGVRPLRGCSVVVDSGFSFTHVVPLWEDSVVLPSVRRINVGGKVLTSVLKESVSYRSMNMMDEPFITESVKDSLCFTSLDPLLHDLPLSSRRGGTPDTLRADYVLPDGVHYTRGFVKDPSAADRALTLQREHLARLAPQGEIAGCILSPPPGERDLVTSGRGGPPARRGGAPAEEQVLTLTNERFMVPEALFHPSDIGIPQGGLAEAIVSALEAIPPPLHQFFYSNIVLVGGSTQFPFFRERLALDLRPLVPKDIEIGITLPPEPSLCAWRGASAFAASPSFVDMRVTRAEYQERGSAACTENFSYQVFQ